jgi:AraC-like DNA-binding protein
MVRFGEISISEIRIAPQTIVRRASLVQDSTATLHLLFVLNGELRVRGGDQQLLLRALDWMVYGSDAATLSAPETTEALLMTIPASMHVPARDVIHSAASGVCNVLLACIRSALKAAHRLTPQARVELGNTLDDLARLSLREQAAPSPRMSGRAIMRDRVKGFVRQRLRDSNLSIEEIAQTFNCTKRYLHKVFSEDERSLNQYIWELRLDRCSHDLARIELLDCSITRIAYIWGFRSPTHFSRVFRQRFGLSPSLYRSMNARARPAPVIAPRLEPAAGLSSRRSIAPYVERIRTTS